MVFRLTAVGMTVAVGMFAATAEAGPIVNPGTVLTNTMGNYGPSYDVEGLRDQSGLSATYTSGVTDFLTFTTTTTHSSANDSDTWLSSGPNVLPGYIDFDLGGAQVITELALWNGAAGSTANVQNFRVFTSNDPNFLSSTLVGSFTNPMGVGAGTPYPASIFNVMDTTAQYWRLQIDSYYGNGCCVSVGEVALETGPSTVPEPASAVLLTLGMFGVASRRRRRAAAVQESDRA